MTITIQKIHEDILTLKQDIKCILLEDFELSDFAKKSLKQARKTSENKYVNL